MKYNLGDSLECINDFTVDTVWGSCKYTKGKKYIIASYNQNITGFHIESDTGITYVFTDLEIKKVFIAEEGADFFDRFDYAMDLV